MPAHLLSKMQLPPPLGRGIIYLFIHELPRAARAKLGVVVLESCGRGVQGGAYGWGRAGLIGGARRAAASLG